MVMKDVLTDFRYVYPAGRRDANSTVLSMKHFVDDLEKIGVFYSDNAPEIVSAMKSIKVRHQISRDYISTSNAIAERAVRSTLEGTRANLLQAGLHHGYWPYAARHWCIMHDAAPDGTGKDTPWKLRFGTEFPGPLIPFGCKVDYWTGPRKRPKKQIKFDPTSEPGIFLGYKIHPGFRWRKEFAVASLKQLNDASFDEYVTILRVIKVMVPERIEFPCRLRADAIREGRTSHDQPIEDDSEEPPPLENQDAQPVREPGQVTRTIKDIESGQPAQQSSASAVYHQGWLAFLNHVDFKEAWYEFAECKVNVRLIENTLIGPSSEFTTSDYPYRTICSKNDGSWHVMEENLKIDPPIEGLEREVEIQEVLATIFSKEPIDLRNPISEPGEEEIPAGDVEVINPITGEIEKIRSNDPSYYDAGGFKARKYKNSSKPKDIPPFVWRSMSLKERRAIHR